MSTHYSSLTVIKISELLDGRLDSFNVREYISENTSPTWRCLTDGFNYVWVHVNDAALVTSFTRYFPGGNPRYILDSIATMFDTDIVSEYEPQFWGFDSEGEWEAYQHQIHEKYEDEFYDDLLKFIAGKPCDIRPGTVA